MHGLVLWFNPEVGVGVVWCEDQGPLAFLGPDVVLPGGLRRLECGDQLLFSIELREGVRYVRDLFSVTAGNPAVDPREVIAGYHRTQDRARHLSIVA